MGLSYSPLAALFAVTKTTIMMKQKLNATGVAQVQANLLALDDQALKLQTQAMRQNFNGWMDGHFELSNSQKQQLQEMPGMFRDELSHSIADALERRQVVAFAKEGEKEDEPDPDQNSKDIIIFSSGTTRWRVGEDDVHDDERLSIVIRYS